ncbi:MAG TPA: TonB-dependent receptor [Gemmatimonadaceae bacterium]|nr:TonB-dependent receptor [Gemmatimonadaceae bacterium]
MPRSAITLLVLGPLAAHVLAAQVDSARAKTRAGTIDGVVSDTTLAPLAEATVSILGSDIRIVTGTSGRFRMVRIPPGQYIVLVRRLGFEPTSARLQVAEAETLRVSFSLERVVATLDTVRVATPHVSPRLAEFDARRKWGEGQFMTQDQIEKANSPWVSSLLGAFKHVTVVYDTFGAHAWNFRGIGKKCLFQILVDGLPQPSPDLDRLPSPKELAGIEVYFGAATIPLQYKRLDGATCGLIMIWTRDGS